MSRQPTYLEEQKCEEKAISKYIDSSDCEQLIKELYSMVDDADIIETVRNMQDRIQQDYSHLIQERVNL